MQDAIPYSVKQYQKPFFLEEFAKEIGIPQNVLENVEKELGIHIEWDTKRELEESGLIAHPTHIFAFSPIQFMNKIPYVFSREKRKGKTFSIYSLQNINIQNLAYIETFKKGFTQDIDNTLIQFPNKLCYKLDFIIDFLKFFRKSGIEFEEILLEEGNPKEKEYNPVLIFKSKDYELFLAPLVSEEEEEENRKGIPISKFLSFLQLPKTELLKIREQETLRKLTFQYKNILYDFQRTKKWEEELDSIYDITSKLNKLNTEEIDSLLQLFKHIKTKEIIEKLKTIDASKWMLDDIKAIYEKYAGTLVMQGTIIQKRVLKYTKRLLDKISEYSTRLIQRLEQIKRNLVPVNPENNERLSFILKELVPIYMEHRWGRYWKLDDLVKKQIPTSDHDSGKSLSYWVQPEDKIKLEGIINIAYDEINQIKKEISS